MGSLGISSVARRGRKEHANTNPACRETDVIVTTCQVTSGTRGARASIETESWVGFEREVQSAWEGTEPGKVVQLLDCTEGY